MEIWADSKSSCAAWVSGQNWATTVQYEDDSVLLFPYIPLIIKIKQFLGNYEKWFE